MFNFLQVLSLYAGAEAESLTKIAGTDSGLCAVIAYGENLSASLPAELAAKGKILVHCITDNSANLAKIRSAVSSAKLEGFATIEVLPLAPLPYRDNLVNLIVVENSSAAKQAGLSDKEMMRVLAPGGKLCTKDNGQWKTITKEIPADMDVWTHEYHGPDGSFISNDKQIKFPLGYRWNGGLPMNVANSNRNSKSWANTVGMVVADKKCFTLSSSVVENTPVRQDKNYIDDLYVSAYDAFNGILLWRKQIPGTFYGGLIYINRAPFVISGKRLYAANGEGKLVEMDTDTGATVRNFDTAFPPVKVLVDDGLIAVSGWKDGSIVGGLTGVDRRRMDFRTEAGAVEVFDVKSGARLWKMDRLATSMVSAGGILYMVQREGPDKAEEVGLDPKLRKTLDKSKIPQRPMRTIMAAELKTGKVIWTKTSEDLECTAYLKVASAGKDAVSLLEDTGKKSYILSAKDGSLLKTGSAVHIDFNVEQVTGKVAREEGIPPHMGVPKPGCTPSFFANDMLLCNRDAGEYKAKGGKLYYYGIRGGCVIGTIPAYGLLYVPQNWCGCNPAQIDGIIAVGTITGEPSVADMEKATPLEKGEAYSPDAQEKKVSNTDTATWHMYRANPDRSNSSETKAPAALDTLWQTKVAEPIPDGLIARNWKDSLRGLISAPVNSGAVVAMAVPNRNEVVLTDAVTGKIRHRLPAGGRVDSSPTLYEGLCLFGSQNGYLYAYRCEDGKLAWRTRVAPREERIVSYAQVASPWPVFGSVLVSDGLVFASAGRTQGSDGGIVVRSYEPHSGKLVWSKALAESEISKALPNMKRNDLLLKVGDSIQVGNLRLDPATGKFKENPTYTYKLAQIDIRRLKAKGKDESKVKIPELTEISPQLGIDGLAYSYWPWLGGRKHSIELMPIIKDSHVLEMAWNKDMQAAVFTPGNSITLYKSASGAVPLKTSKLWSKDVGPKDLRCSSVVLCGDAVVVGGGIYESNPQSGYIGILSLKDGSLLCERRFDSPLVYNGLAVSGDSIFASFEDGTVCRLGSGSGSKK